MEEKDLNEINEEKIEITEEKIIINKIEIDSADEEKEIPPVIESTQNPYYEEDPKVGGAEYKPSKFLSRGCSSCPKSYHAVDQREIHSCAKMDDHNWMKNIRKPFNENNFDIVEVRFKNNRKEFFKLPDGLEVMEGDVVAVEGSPGHDVGIVSMTGELCRIQMKKRNIDVESVKKLYRRAKTSDIEKWVQSFEQEDHVIKKTKGHINSLDLSMKLNDVEIQGDGSKAIFYYTADDRVDFRNLIKILADEFKVRIEMKQIGVRQESSRLGGIGTCGRELCCATWLTNFQSVNTSVAKAQQIALNPQKLAGQCGKLKCCLNYEYEIYVDAVKDFPDSSISLKTKKGNANYVKTDIFRKLMWYSYENGNDMYAISVDSVKQIISMNEKGELPERIEDYKTELMSKTAQEASDMEMDISLLSDKIETAVQERNNQRQENNRREHRPSDRNQNGQRPQNNQRQNNNSQSHKTNNDNINNRPQDKKDNQPKAISGNNNQQPGDKERKNSNHRNFRNNNQNRNGKNQ